MSGTNASIPLAFNPQPLGPSLGQAIDVASGFQTLQANAQKLAGQNALRAIFSDPRNLDASGMPTQNAINQIMAADPGTGMALMQNKQRLYNQQMSARLAQLKIGDRQQSMIRDVGTDAMEAYQRALDGGMSPDAARKIGQEAYTQGYDRLRSSGMFSPDQTAALSPQFDPNRTQSNIDYFKYRDQERTRARERYTEPATYIGTDAQGQPAQVEVQQDKVSGQWVTADAKHTPVDVSKMHKAGAGELQSGISDETADLIADRFLAGDKTALTGFGRSVGNQTKIANAITRRAGALGMSGPDIARKQAEFQGAISAERALSMRAANMEMAANEVKFMAPLALSASEKVDRTQYPTLNSILLTAEKGTGNEDVVRFGLAANSLIYIYSKFLNPTGIPTDADKARATEILSTAWSKGQFKVAVDQIEKEIKSGQLGVAGTKEEVGAGISGRPAPGAPPAPAGGGGSGNQAEPPPAQTEGTEITLPKPDASGEYDLSKSDPKQMDALFDKLPHKVHFVGPDGKTYWKP